MSFYSDASLVMIPSGYKTSKVYSAVPTDGSGDLSFTRTADTATRVNSSGLIEKVRTNLILQSNTFSTNWSNVNSTETSGQAGYDGTSNAWLLQSTIALGEAYLRQTISASGSNTFSIYAKAGTSNFLAVYVNATSGTDPFAYFNLSTGAVGTTSATATASIVSVGSGWYRCSVAYNATISNIDVYVTTADNSFLSTTGDNILIQNAQLEAGDIATDYISTTTAAVSVGPVANVPRLDYLNSSCPRLLLEGQRTNLALWSESFDNAAWTKTFSSITANIAVSPDGYTNADKLIPNTTLDVHQASQVITLADNTSYAFSCFAKADGYNFLRLAPTTKAGVTNSTFFNLSNGTVGTVGAGHTASIVSYGNGWYRCTIVYNSATGASSTNHRVAVCQSDNQISFAGNGTSGILIYGAQHELGSYSSSYVNTLGAAVTRGADSASKTGISSLIGSAAGTIYLEVAALANDLTDRRFALSDGTASNVARVGFGTTSNSILAVLFNGANQCLLSYTGADITSTNKIAFTWSSNDFALFVNGVKRASDTSGTTFAANTLTRLGFDNGAASGADGYGKFDQVLLFKSRLSDSQLAELTA